MLASVSVNAHSQCPNCAHPIKQDPRLVIAMRIGALALGAFAAYVEWKLFVAALLVGIPAGVFWGSKGNQSPQSACSQGVIDNLTQTQLHPIINLIFGAAVTVCHIDHHPTIFVPIVGFSLGAWVGTYLK
jgi:hypothetical protein